MPKIVLFVTLWLVLTQAAEAQQSVGDSIRYYQHEIQKTYKAAWDSVRQSASYIANIEKIKEFEKQSKSYSSFMLFTEVSGTDFTSFNKSIAQNGFGPLSGPVYRVGLGYSHKGYKGFMFDFTYAILGFNKNTAKGEEKIRTSFSNLLMFQFGYAVVNTRRFNIYPYAGLGLRSALLQYDKPVLTNPNYSSIADIIQNDGSTSSAPIKIGYQAGLGIDWVVYRSKTSNHGVILFGKFGTDGAIGHETYKIEDIRYSPDIKFGSWIGQLGFKFF